jgi:gamma-aminobutyric acid type B receptor
MFVIGSGCSPRAQPVATTINFINMMMVDYSASSPVLARRTLFPNFFRLEFNEKSNQLGQANFIRYLYRELSNQKVGVVLQDTPLFTDSWDAVQTQAFSTSGIETSVVRVANDLKLADFEQLLQTNFGVDPPAMFIVNAFEGQARRVFCWAVRRNLIYPKHTWLFVGWYGARWWEQNSTTSDCTVQELETFLNRTITVITEGKPDNDSAKTDVSLTRLEFREQYAEYCKNTSEVLNRDCNVDRLLTFNTYAYDSVWTMVLAMNKSLMTLSADAFNNFTFFNDSVGISVELRRQLQLTNFTGISGTVEFTEYSGDRVLHPVTLSQYRFNASGVLETKAFGLVDGTMVTDLTGSRLDLNIIFDDGIPPHRALKHINSVLYGFLTAVAIMGIILSIFFIVFTLVYRNRKIVKATSPKLNIIIVFGGILLYFSVILTHIPSNNAEYSLLACSYIPWLVNTGLVLMYVPLILKAWRVYYIFNRSSTKASVVSILMNRGYFLFLKSLHSNIIFIFTAPTRLEVAYWAWHYSWDFYTC